MEGYQKLASLIASNSEYALFRKFATIQVQNLLYLQAELTHLEAQLAGIVQEDVKASQDGDAGRKELRVSWLALKESRLRGTDRLQYEKVMEIRSTLKEYNKSLLRFAAIQKLPNAEARNHHQLEKWLSRDDGGGNFLRNRERTPWTTANFDDLVSADPTEPPNLFVQLWNNTVVKLYHNVTFMINPQRRATESEMASYSDSKVDAASRVLGTFLAAAFPMASIFALNFVHDKLIRLGILSAFVTAFSVAMAVLTKATATEIFAATAAYSAVLVVFVSGL